jgi:hypothetical protein
MRQGMTAISSCPVETAARAAVLLRVAMRSRLVRR